MDRIPKNVDSKFRFVLLAAGRAEQLMRGAPPKVALTVGKPTEVALDEVRKSLVPWEWIEVVDPITALTPESVQVAEAE
jgi:DNA-directed RNA polymerase omega subunit